MSRRIIFKHKEIHFPPACVVCQLPAERAYPVQRTISYANRRLPVMVRVPLCAHHFTAAVEIGPRERYIRRVGLAVGAVIGVSALVGLLRLWTVPGAGVTILNLFVAALVATSLFALIWSAANFFIAPLLAGPDVVSARHGVRILRYWPRTGQIQLEFESETAADAIAEANREQVVLVH